MPEHNRNNREFIHRKTAKISNLQSKIIHIQSHKDLCLEVNSDDLQIWALYLMTIKVLSAMILTLRAVILRESTVECLKMYHRDWPISLLTNF